MLEPEKENNNITNKGGWHMKGKPHQVGGGGGGWGHYKNNIHKWLGWISFAKEKNYQVVITACGLHL